MIVDENNVIECFKFYEEYKENERKTNPECEDASYDDFVDWSLNNLYQCPNCKEIVLESEQTHLDEPYNSDSVCDECIENLDYYDRR